MKKKITKDAEEKSNDEKIFDIIVGSMPKGWFSLPKNHFYWDDPRYEIKELLERFAKYNKNMINKKNMKNKKKICFTTIDDVIVEVNEVNEEGLKVENNISEEELAKMVAVRTYQSVKKLDKDLDEAYNSLKRIEKCLEEKEDDVDMVLVGNMGEDKPKFWNFRKCGKIIAYHIGAIAVGGVVGILISYGMFKWFSFIGKTMG